MANVNCWKKECNTELADWAKCVNKFILKEKYDLSCWCVTNFPADTIPAPGAAQTMPLSCIDAKALSYCVNGLSCDLDRARGYEGFDGTTCKNCHTVEGLEACCH